MFTLKACGYLLGGFFFLGDGEFRGIGLVVSRPAVAKRCGVTKPISVAGPQKCLELVKFLADSGLYENKVEAEKREEVLRRIHLSPLRSMTILMEKRQSLEEGAGNVADIVEDSKTRLDIGERFLINFSTMENREGSMEGSNNPSTPLGYLCEADSELSSENLSPTFPSELKKELETNATAGLELKSRLGIDSKVHKPVISLMAS
ncbi:hypothetical protein MLD38_028919 [Melastoma candidum]|uniref:Uncharacterized protein n=1 Tax=Melastoma candidum TaxID=119954 RepID=A0ACB9N307_9MYRT|nr:hypothetical protein MLD38_028919 [Melastoma candidum]